MLRFRILFAIALTAIVVTVWPGGNGNAGATAQISRSALRKPSGSGSAGPTLQGALSQSQKTSSSSAPTKAGSAYSNLVLSDNPDVFYRLDEARGKIAHDSSHHHHDGTFAKGISYRLAGPILSDPGARAVGSQSTDPIVTAKDTGLPSGSMSRTLEAWIKEYPSGSGNCCSPNAPVISYGNLAKGHGFSMGLAGPFNPSVWVETKPNGRQISTPAPITIYEVKDKWHLLDVTFDAGTVVFYLDGQQIGSEPMTLNTFVTKQKLQIGGWAGIADAAIYSGALSASQIDAHWTAAASPVALSCASPATSAYGKLVRHDGLLALWQLNDRAASRVAYDYSGQCHNAAYAETTRTTRSGPLQSDSRQLASSETGQPAAIAGDSWLPSGGQSRTVEAWVREFAPTSGGCCSPNQAIVSYGDIAGGHGFAFGYDGPFNPSIWVKGDHAKQIVTPAPIDVYETHNQWHLVDVTLSRGRAIIYLDGQSVGSGKLAVDTKLPGQGLQIGGWSGIGEVAVYHSALTAGQIDRHWTTATSPTATRCSSLLKSTYASLVRHDGAALFFPLDDRSISRVAYDQSGHCRNGAYDDATTSVQGPLPTSPDVEGVTTSTSTPVAIASADGLPSGNKAVTLETWMRSPGACCASGVALQYGNVASGHGFSDRGAEVRAGRVAPAGRSGS